MTSFWISGQCTLGRTASGELFLLAEPDPQVLISDELLRGLLCLPSLSPDIELIRPTEGHGSQGHAVGFEGCEAPAGAFCFHNNIVKIHATNRDVVYRIRDYDWEHNAWKATWPD